MKNLSLSASFIVCLFFISCKKEATDISNTNVTIDNSDLSTSAFNDQYIAKPSMQTLYVAYNFHTGEVVDARCLDPSGGCFHTIYVTGFTPTLDIIDGNNIVNIRTWFNNNEPYLDGVFDPSTVQEVIDGNYTVSNLGVFDKDGVDAAYIQFFDENGDLVSTNPVEVSS